MNFHRSSDVHSWTTTQLTLGNGRTQGVSADLLMARLSAQRCEDRVAFAHSRVQRDGPFPWKLRVDLAWQREGDPDCFVAA